MARSLPDIEAMSIPDLREELKEYRKEICQSCRGKGYSTYYRGIRGSADFKEEEAFEEPIEVQYQACSCSRGQSFMEMVKEQRKRARLDVLKHVYRTVKRKHPVVFRDNILKAVDQMYGYYYRGRAKKSKE